MPPLGFIEAPATRMTQATTGLLQVRVNRGNDLGLESEGTVAVDETSAILTLNVPGGADRSVPTLTAALLGADGELVAEPVAMTLENAHLVARFSFTQSVLLEELEVLLFGVGG